MMDWSASNTPNRGKDSIWIGFADRKAGDVALRPSRNPRTRHEAMAIVGGEIRAAAMEGVRLLLGFDFPFGYPRGTASKVAGSADWRSLWKRIASLVRDGDDNSSNRFEVAGRLNRTALADGPMFWGRPSHLDVAGLTVTRPVPYPGLIPERRLCELRAPRAQPVWKLAYAGSVGSQALLGIARLEALLCDPDLRGHVAVWPFETDTAAGRLAPCVMAEIYPSLFPVEIGARSCLDEAQVETLAKGFAEADAAGHLAGLLAPASDLTHEERGAVLSEEGWILGLGSPGFTAPPALPPPPLTYLRDPAAIYEASFAAIRAEADLGRVPDEARDLAIRLVHACGMPDILDDLAVSPGAVEAGRAALAAGRPILCDAEMVAHGVIARNLPAANDVLCRLNEPEVAPLAARLGTTRSAAQVDLWDDALEGAVVAIGNAPTALFRLLERLDAGAPRPAVILGLPVGFVGAAEAKAELARHSRGVPFVTIHGRRGGSALASAAVNALAAGLAGGIA